MRGVAELYYCSVTAHGTAMGYVFPTLVAMGFGYAITEASLTRPHWAQVALGGVDRVAVGTVTALIPVSMGIASVLYKFYLPMVGNPFYYYIGVVLVVVGSWIWVGLIVVNVHAWKRANPGAPVPLPMYVNVGGSLLWGRASDETDHLRTADVQR
jgi:cytochrome c oxidase subunit 1